MSRFRLFISSVQKELAEERAAVRAYVERSRFLRRHFEVYRFEDEPAADLGVQEAYLDEVERCDVYLAIFGNEYGWAEADELSPTHKEYAAASQSGKYRIVFVKSGDDNARDKRMRALIREASDQVVRRRFESLATLITSVDDALIKFLEDRNVIHDTPFDARGCPGATMADLDVAAIQRFGREHLSGRFEKKAPEEILEHLNLLDEGVPNHAGILLFAKNPQKHLPEAVVKCAHFHSDKPTKPIPSAHTYAGSLMEMIEHSIDFVMAKIARSIGSRRESAKASVSYEIPREAVAEAIINAIVHRDYASGGSVQVSLFSDRLEVKNPGRLPHNLTVDDLKGAHVSVPCNPRLTGPLSRTEYMESFGTGTGDMIERCREAGLPDPSFHEDRGFTVTLFRPTGQASGQDTAKPDKMQTGQVSGQATGQNATWILKVLALCAEEPRKSAEIQAVVGIKHRETFQRNYLDFLLSEDLIERTLPDKLRSPLQKYKITQQGGKRLREKL